MRASHSVVALPCHADTSVANSTQQRFSHTSHFLTTTLLTLSPNNTLSHSLTHPHQASLKADQVKLTQLQQQEAQADSAAEQVTQQVEALAAQQDDLKKQVGAVCG